MAATILAAPADEVAGATRLLWGRHDPYGRRAGIEAAADGDGGERRANLSAQT